MSTNPIAPPVRPDLRTLLNNNRRDTATNLNCHLLGEIVSFDETTHVASVQITSLKVLPDGSQVRYPVLTDCPVFVNGGGVLTYPIAVGERCLVLFHDTDMDTWFATGNTTAPNTSRTHSLSDGLVMVGFPNLAHPISGSTYVRLANRTSGAEVALFDSGEVFINSGTSYIQIAPSGDVNLTSSGNVTITAIGTGKLMLTNGVTSLHTALDNLMNALAAWVNTGGSTPNPATVAALAAVKTDLDGLLQ